jgi:aryl-alcohol dehydrogenase-like predicted oxidoreductase
MYAWQFARYLYQQEKMNATRFVSMQDFYNLIYREEEREMLPLCKAEGIGVIPWSPLARGFLAGNRNRDGKGQTTRANSDNVILQSNVFSESDYATRDKVEEIARQRNVSSAQVALAWLLHQPAVTAPIVGASKLSHLDDAIAATELSLSEEELKALGQGYKPKRIIGHA